ncbi:single-stranded DNA-binding protein [Acidovorax facilis]|uniref:single-stranded DNA-binding protein n=1 Tax=Acidovorax facilis TaxID=12917 RepID=UPI003D648249
MYSATILLGYLGADPESRTTREGKTVVNFRMATSEFIQGEEKTFWHNVVVLGRDAETAAKHLKKGAPVFILGSPRVRSYEKDGHTVYVHEIISNVMKLLPSSKPSGNSAPTQPAGKGSGSNGNSTPPADDNHDDGPW